MGVREVRDTFTECLDTAQTESILVLKHGKPYAVIQGVEGRELTDLIKEEEYRVEHHKKKKR